MTPYRTAPTAPAPQKAPRASWWRRLTHHDVERRLAVRRRRHALRERYPWAPWRDCHDIAADEWLRVHGPRGVEQDAAALAAALQLRALAKADAEQRDAFEAMLAKLGAP